ncbi:MAG TPA: sigma-54-dependent Fis family transcriptional regulator [Steroidobacteraceae bacterium]|nr:sigma-54-dependent Fis family transcriptional regulator [Steroidobacteraceae bacterium]
MKEEPGLHADRVLSVVARPARASQDRATPVDESWRRCLVDFKLDPMVEYQPLVLDALRLRERRDEHEDLVEIARAEMDLLYEQISGSGYALLLADTDGVILCEKVDSVLRSMFSRAGLLVGAEWSERAQGTNGIGTCVTESMPITIHQSDHFRSRHVGLSCSASPIHDPDGRLVAVLDASSVNAGGTRESQTHTVALVSSSARLIEKCLFLRRYCNGLIVRFHPRSEFVSLIHDGMLAVGGDGRILAADAISMRLLGVRNRAELVGRSVSEVFDASYDELARRSAPALRQFRDQRCGRGFFANIVNQEHTSGGALPTRSAGDPVHVAPEAEAGCRSLAELAGGDPQMERNVRNARRVANNRVPIVIRGPTGSGKEVFARALHAASHRATRPFVAVNCAAIPEHLIESELFGYERGAFTGARREGMRGRFLQASGGTLFLDEIGDMPLALQTRLLRVLESGEVIPLGGELPLRVDVRVMCATHRNLSELMRRGAFREDLYYRLNGICIELPALARRGDKEALILQCFAREVPAAGISIERVAFSKLLDHDWPGNIRELRSVVRTALALCEGGTVRETDLPAEVCRPRLALVDPLPRVAEDENLISLASAERQALLKVIEQHQWNMTLVAAHFGISRNTLYRKIKRHGIRIERPILRA